jgi:hypothetical protein
MRPAVLLLLAILSGGCVGASQREKPLTDEQARAFVDRYVRVGSTTMERAVLEIGRPSSVFEEGRIVTFRIGPTWDGKATDVVRGVTPEEPGWWGSSYSLVLIADEAGIVQRTSLVPVRGSVWAARREEKSQ